MSTDKTPLQKAIKEAIDAHPTLEDKEIAVLAFKARYPDETYEGSDPSSAYVAKMRKRLVQAGEAPEIIAEKVEVETPEAPEAPELEEPGLPEEEPEIPFEEQFEIPTEPEEPFFIESVDGFTQGDTDFLLTFTFDKIADWTGYDGWRFRTDPTTGRLLDANERRFSGLTHRMMEKYMPTILDEYFMEFMFCYTGIMLIGFKGKGYMDWRRSRKAFVADLKPEVERPPEVEEAPEIEEASEILEQTPEEQDEEITLPVGAKALGEGQFLSRMRRELRE